MKYFVAIGIACLLCSVTDVSSVNADQAKFLRLPANVYRDKMAGGWIGQMAGVGWGGPTEFKWQGEIIPADKLPQWKPEMINQFHQDDIYVEMTFLRTLELHGWDVSWKQAGIDFANSRYPLWHANAAGRNALRNGIAPPDSGHPEFNKHADDIDYQIEADYSGLIAPGMPNLAIELGEKFGRIMNYGDGLYGGQFVGGMYAAAFLEDDPLTIVKIGLKCIPAKSQFAECIRDTIRWYKAYPDDWTKAWEKINQKYQLNHDYRKFSCSGPDGKFNIDAKINGAFIVMGLLYGHSDMDQTIIISTRCGQDSDCNPANSGGILGTVLGRSKLPSKFTSKIDPNGVFSHTAYSFPLLVDVCDKLVREAVVREGGKIETGDDGKLVFVIPIVEPKPSKLEQCWEPGPAQHVGFSEQEMNEINTGLKPDCQKRFPGWTIRNCGPDMEPGLKDEFRGKKNVFLTHPLERGVGCVLSKTMKLQASPATQLRLTVGHHPDGDWRLIVKANGQVLASEIISPETATNGWRDLSVDLTRFAGKEVKLELINEPTDWRFEAGYWAKIALEPKQ